MNFDFFEGIAANLNNDCSVDIVVHQLHVSGAHWYRWWQVFDPGIGDMQWL
jgi:hypothetical protein